ncbi:MAG: hypothetical protein WCC48_05055 [Anaeromyxobacteraceae bacterium]
MTVPDNARRARLARALGPARRVLVYGAMYGAFAGIALGIRGRLFDPASMRWAALFWAAAVGAFFFAALAFGVTRHLVGETLRPARRRWVVCWATSLAWLSWLLLIRALQGGLTPGEGGILLFWAAVGAGGLRLSKVTRIEEGSVAGEG